MSRQTNAQKVQTLLSGRYPTKEEANAAAKTIRETVLPGSPWRHVRGRWSDVMKRWVITTLQEQDSVK